MESTSVWQIYNEMNDEPNSNASNLDAHNGSDEFKSNHTGPPELMLQQNFTVIIVYSALFVVAAIGNLTVFISLFRSRHRKSRISLMIRHLAIADLIVTFIMIPIEVGWRLTGRWIAGNVACKVFLFLRAFGPYLSSNVLVCVSLDRYFAVLHPLRVNDARRRGKVMLAFAWGTSFIYCFPQSFVFRVQKHPEYPQYEQCVSFGFFTSTSQEIAYNLMSVMFLYFIPLFVIVIAYTAIMCEISKNSKETRDASKVCNSSSEEGSYRTSNGRMRLRRSDITNIERARSRTLRMTITIVVVYVMCCTPYVIITLWYMFDRDSAKRLPDWLQDTFFMMVVSNSCMNPIVYGSYVLNFTRSKCCCCKKGSNDVNLNNCEEQAAAGRDTNRRLAGRVIKGVLSFRKVGSGATRSTTMHGNNVISRSPTPKTLINNVTHIKKGRLPDRPPSVGHISFLDEPGSRGYRQTFHSDPCSSPYFSESRGLDIAYQCADYTNSEPNMSPKCNIKMNINRAEVYYNRERTRTRYI
ncbi:adipokinetic hormone/corazonin-related peptide receptor variant I-like [Aethina tumida]|uniref:adipokinetic hormone/corazonin-related peptide receptor variant I-like n=1 Tax=Aethina tumida TaxID=116153 RepID=UPI002149933D|nr:adipokinetic hormone/corazonin-related peptide receptor variant I-like [Aethina tumida]